MTTGLLTPDYIFIVLYFCVVAGIGYWSSKKSLTDSKNYFLAGGHIGWVAIGASLFASNISAEHFIGLSGTGSKSGLAVGQFEWLACFILLVLGWVFVPFYLRTGVFTMPEFLERRFDARSRMYLSAISLIAYIFTKVSVTIYAGAMVLETILGWNILTAALFLIIATGIYTIFGGLRAVIYTDYFQAFVLIGGGIVLTTIAIMKVGGFGGLFAQVPPEFFNIWKPATHPEFPWTGILFGAPILGIWYWCTDQVIVQRTLAASKVSDARRATIMAGFLKILPVFILVLPGLAGSVLFPGTAADKLYPTMVNNLLPVGVKGFVVAGFLAALMAALAAVFNSSSTLVVMDFYKKFRKEANEKELVVAGQIATAMLVVVGLLWIPFISKLSGELYIYLQSVQAYISPPIAAVFLLGILWKRVNGSGAFAALIAGFVIGATRFITELGVKSGWIQSDFLRWYAQINFLHFAILLFVISIAIIIVVSLMTPKPSKEKIEQVFATAEHAEAEKAAETPGEHRVNVGLSMLLVGLVLLFWVYFSPIFFKGAGITP